MVVPAFTPQTRPVADDGGNSGDAAAPGAANGSIGERSAGTHADNAVPHYMRQAGSNAYGISDKAGADGISNGHTAGGNAGNDTGGGNCCTAVLLLVQVPPVTRSCSVLWKSLRIHPKAR